MPNLPIMTPAGYTDCHAVAYSDPNGNALLVSANMPLPVALSGGAALAVSGAGGNPLLVSVSRPLVTPLAGTATTSATFGPFVPALDRPAIITLSGTWTGTVSVTRSTDGGVTRLPLTAAGASWGQYSANVCEPCWEEFDPAATLYLNIAITTGTLNYRIAQ